jgi:thiol-disulfide isomerase/thioredoxin
MARSTRLKVFAASAGCALVAGLMLMAGCKQQAPETSSAALPPAPTPTPARVPVTLPPAVGKHLYPSIDEAPADIKAGIALAHRTHKRVLLDFGGDWCGDCQVLDIYFNEEPNADLLAKNFVRVNVNIGRQDANIDIANKYGVPIRGVPALAVLDGNGKVVMAQDHEFSSMRNMQPTAVTDFLNKWKS